ncbi:uncharacterized protein PV09_05996 [Verruconis gallopava]|uniref:Cardiolipin synthase N-terminal domain-containing protein n=1 Tax=Verruconis gallopava TaxID=253628 RepID=A0A0D2ATV2_9PEZI|nr:uncharacterized protein PV09_05996 [Verruconis gallopava]KIW02539.1 hypothetical protein PV09_05996 [Verruconis gallopava]
MATTFQLAIRLLLQLFLTVSFAASAPLNTQNHARPWHYGVSGGIVGFIVLVLDIIVWLEVLQSNRTVPQKLLWALLVFIFPIGGVIIYFLFSNRDAHRTGGYEPI